MSYEIRLEEKLAGPSIDRTRMTTVAMDKNCGVLVDFCRMKIIPKKGKGFMARAWLRARFNDENLVYSVIVEEGNNNLYSLYKCTAII